MLPGPFPHGAPERAPPTLSAARRAGAVLEAAGMTWLRQHGYWWVEAMPGVAAIFTPFAAHLSTRPLPTLTNVIAGILLLG